LGTYRLHSRTGSDAAAGPGPTADPAAPAAPAFGGMTRSVDDPAAAVPPTVAPSARASTTASAPSLAAQAGCPGKEVATSASPTREAIATPFHWFSPWTATS